MKVFTQEVKNCSECNFCQTSKEFNHCNFTNFELQENLLKIDLDCPFNKPLTKEDVESFGFLFNPNTNNMSKNMNNTNYYLKQWNDKSVDISRITDGEGYVVTMFQGTITSKPHLEFILQSLNII